MILQYEYITNVDFSPSIGCHNILLRCLPAREAFQQVLQESFDISDGFWYHEATDGLSNRIITGGMQERHNQLHYRSSGIVEINTYCIPDQVPHPMYSMSSILTTPHSDMQSILPVLTNEFLHDCINIMHQVHKHITYSPATTGILTTAADVYLNPVGVCQDYAHLMIALCRMIGLPSRYACGFITGEGQTHAWVEVHDGICWYAFDPTNDTPIATGYIKLAHGRDAHDCSVSRGIYTGISQQETHISVTANQLQQHNIRNKIL